jgi:hypothetical protein
MASLTLFFLNSEFIVNDVKASYERLATNYAVSFIYVFSRHGLHFISDEAYAMSIYEPNTPFRSVLNLWPPPDPQKTHVIWSFSKVRIISCSVVT